MGSSTMGSPCECYPEIVRCLAKLNDSISPSVYVIYSSIHASASCVALVNSHLPIGSIHTAVTRAYEPSVLSTAICEALNMGAGIEHCISPVNDQNDPKYCFQGIDNGWRQINYPELIILHPHQTSLPDTNLAFRPIASVLISRL